MKSYIYIDWANLHQWAKSWWGIDYRKLKQWLVDKYDAQKIYLFIWYIKWKESLYSQLSLQGYTLIFKETLEIDGKVKGNCDAELVVQAMSNYYEHPMDQSILITWDGDFACLIYFFISKNHHISVIAPNKNYCSYLIKKTTVPIVMLEELKHKLQSP